MGASSSGVARMTPLGLVVARVLYTTRRRVADRYFTLVAILPTFVVMLCIFGIPLLFSLYLSFTGGWTEQGLLGGAFVGLSNYEDLLADPVFGYSLGLTFCYTRRGSGVADGTGA